MAFKSRTESDELKILRSLNARMELPEKDKKYYLNKVKGFEGEVKFDLLTEMLSNQPIILNDLLLEVNNTKFQIDTTIIFQNTIDICEVKNYEGEYFYHEDYFKTSSEKEIQNPLDQLKRCKILLHQLLQNLGFKIPIEGYVTFINSEFTLFNVPQIPSFILPTQINSFMKKLALKPAKLNERHKKLAQQLVALHQIEPPYNRLPPYAYDKLRKGPLCGKCYSFMVSAGSKKGVCKNCGKEEKIASVIIRSAEEIKLLFPDKKITTSVIHEWCTLVESKKVIRKILNENFNCVVKGKYCYYE